MRYSVIKNYIGGSYVLSSGSKKIPVTNPQDGTSLTELVCSKKSELDDAVIYAKTAQNKWANYSIKKRAHILYKYKFLLEKNIDHLSALISEENGKTVEEGRQEIEKSIELTEFAASMPQILNQKSLEVSDGIFCKENRYPIGVIGSICPFNFPSMVPHWTIPNALVLGNAVIVKPSEKVPLSCQKIADLLKEAGLPDGLFNIVNGDKDVVDAFCENKGIDGLTFVGSTKVAKIVYQKASMAYKRVITFGGAKNHIILLPDASIQVSPGNIVASFTGCAGQRCMAASVLIAVGKCDDLIDSIVKQSKEISVGKNLGAVISLEAKNRIENYITEAEKNGATILLDGRNAVVNGKENGYYVNPTIIDGVDASYSVVCEEIFGPVLSIVRVNNVEEAMLIENNNPYGNACSVFTQSGFMAQYVTERASSGMCGVNIGVPVPREPFGFGGWNESKFGVSDITGLQAIDFFTKTKKITTKWSNEMGNNWMS